MDARSPSLVDLTRTISNSARSPEQQRRTSNPGSSSEHRGTKRRRLSLRQIYAEQPGPSRSQGRLGEAPIESVDLTEVDSPSGLSKALSKQREDAVKAQQQSHGSESGGRSSSLTSYTCPVCMDTPTNATTTICGKEPVYIYE